MITLCTFHTEQRQYVRGLEWEKNKTSSRRGKERRLDFCDLQSSPYTTNTTRVKKAAVVAAPFLPAAAAAGALVAFSCDPFSSLFVHFIHFWHIQITMYILK
jgi:hypothetical protein